MRSTEGPPPAAIGRSVARHALIALVGLSMGCADKDKDKEDAIARAVVAGQAIARTQIKPFRAALGPALGTMPATTSAPCSSLPRDVDWSAQAKACGLDYQCEGVTFIPYENQRTRLPLEDTAQLSRAARVINHQLPRRGVEAFYTMPDYGRLVPEAEAWAKPSYWSYEVVVVDDGGGGSKGRAFSYDYATKAIRCAGVWKAEALGDDGAHRQSAILAAVASLHALL